MAIYKGYLPVYSRDMGYLVPPYTSLSGGSSVASRFYIKLHLCSERQRFFSFIILLIPVHTQLPIYEKIGDTLKACTAKFEQNIDFDVFSCSWRSSIKNIFTLTKRSDCARKVPDILMSVTLMTNGFG